MLESRRIRPTVLDYYPGLESVPRALADLASRKVSGKAVVKVSSDEIAEAMSRL